MAEPAASTPPPAPNGETYKPFVPDNVVQPEFTWSSVVLGAVLGILFGASSLYLLMKAGMTVSASVPIAVLSITLFRAFSRMFGIRRATILENNIVQTTGSAGESLAFGVGVCMPALLLLGFEMSWERVLTVAVLGGVLGILMMIPLRRAFIVKQHGKLKYPEGTACAEVLVAGEKGGASAKMVFIGAGIALVHKFLTSGLKLWPSEPVQPLYSVINGKKVGLAGAAMSGELSPEMMGVGYLIGPRIACLMMAGAVLSFFVLGPMISTFGENLTVPVAGAKANIQEVTQEDGTKVKVDKGLIGNMDHEDLYAVYLRYIGAGAVAAGGIIGMFRAMPLIISSVFSGLRDLRSSSGGGNGGLLVPRTERDLSMKVVIFGCLGLVIVLAAVPQLGLGLSLSGILGALMILVFGFLFVTVSSRLTGEVGSSSNPISGMTIATLLLTCLVFVLVGKTVSTDPTVALTAMSIAAVVCIASSNGGTTSQDLKTGFLVGATPKWQQWSIVIGAVTSALVIGGTMLLLNAGGTHYTKKGIPEGAKVTLTSEALSAAPQQKVGQPYTNKDDTTYRSVFIPEDQVAGVKEGWYLVTDAGDLKYKVDVPIKRDHKRMDDPDDPLNTEKGDEAGEKFKAPQPQLFALIIKGILGGSLQWGLVISGALIAVVLELMGISALPVAVGMYLGLSTATPIFVGGLIRWLTDRWRGVSASEAETETSPGVLLSSGYIAGGTLCGLLLGFVAMGFGAKALSLSQFFGESYMENPLVKLLAVAMFGLLGGIMFYVGSRKSPPGMNGQNGNGGTTPSA